MDGFCRIFKTQASESWQRIKPKFHKSFFLMQRWLAKFRTPWRSWLSTWQLGNLQELEGLIRCIKSLRASNLFILKCKKQPSACFLQLSNLECQEPKIREWGSKCEKNDLCWLTFANEQHWKFIRLWKLSVCHWLRNANTSVCYTLWRSADPASGCDSASAFFDMRIWRFWESEQMDQVFQRFIRNQ